MVWHRAQIMLLKECRQLFSIALARHIDNTTASDSLHEHAQRFGFGFSCAREHSEKQVGTVKRVDQKNGIDQTELQSDLTSHRWCGCRCQREDSLRVDCSNRTAQVEIIRTKVMPPMTHTVR